MQPTKNRGWQVTLAGLGINLALGILYTWSIFKLAIKESILAGTRLEGARLEGASFCGAQLQATQVSLAQWMKARPSNRTVLESQVRTRVVAVEDPPAAVPRSLVQLDGVFPAVAG
jgi:hypothetical protein